MSLQKHPKSRIDDNYYEHLNAYRHKTTKSSYVLRMKEMMRHAEELLRVNENIPEALDLIKKAIVIGDTVEGMDDALFDQSIICINHYAMLGLPAHREPGLSVAESSNTSSTYSLEKSLFLLMNAEKMVRKRKDYRSHQIVSNLYNNLAIALKTNGLFDQAMVFIKKAQSVNFNNKLKTAATDLNMGVLSSAQGK